MTNRSGLFQMDLTGEAESRWIQVAAAGWRPTVIELASLHAENGVDGNRFASVTLVGRPLEIRGTVLDTQGRGIGGALVWTGDRTILGNLEPGFAVEGGRGAIMTEGVISSEPHSDRTTTDEEGRFRMTGLLEKAYRLQAMDPRTLRRAPPISVPAGARDFQIVLSEAQRLSRVQGRVVDAQGNALSSVHVVPAPAEAPRGGPGDPPRILGFGTDTDEAGRFDFPALVTEGLLLCVGGGSAVDSIVFDPDPGSDWSQLLVVLQRQCHFHIEFGPEFEGVDGFEFRNALGRRLPITDRSGLSWRKSLRGDSLGDRSRGVRSVGETARELVLLEGVEERARIHVELTPGRVTRLQP
jgi:hypothetical protein